MATSNSKVKLRRNEVRRQRTEKIQPLLKRWRDRVGVARPSIGLGFMALAILIVLYGRDPFPYYEGQEVRGPIYARVQFKIRDEQMTEQYKQSARELTPNYYELNTNQLERIQGSIGNLYNMAQEYETYEAYLDAASSIDDQGTAQLAQALDEAGFLEFRGRAGETGWETVKRWVDQLVEDLKHERLVPGIGEIERGDAWKSSEAILKGALPNEQDSLTGDQDVAVDKMALDSYTDPKGVERAAATLARSFPASVRQAIRQILVSALQSEPLFKFDLQRTRQQMAENAASQDEFLNIYDPYKLLAQPPLPERAVPGEEEEADEPYLAGPSPATYKLDKDHLVLLQYEHDAVAKLLSEPLDQIEEDQQSAAGALRQQHRFTQVGLGALVVLITLGLITYCGLFQARVLENPVRALSIALLFLIMMAVSRAMYVGDPGVRYPYLVVGPVVMSAAILTMVYSQRFAIGMTAGLALLVTISVRGELDVLLVLTAAMAVAVYQLREIRSRHELFSTGLLNAMAAFIVALVVVLVDGYSLEPALAQAGVAAGAAFVAITIFFVMLPPIERIFMVATNWTLLELLDTSRPLLGRLAQEAPGTFAHSLWLSNMAEAACEAIGANGLLAKVGAMYHDIGKVHKAEYFSENQESQISRHDKLSPTMSLLVIVGHVKDGVELAKEERLPPAIIRFIREHHGTTVVRYFHHVASEQQKAAGNPREVSETEFRYPGPKPQFRETAVVMLCDGVEGAVRALQEPTAGRIENVVHSVLMDRLNDGQFDECDITLKDLHKVEESLVKSLCRFYHGRVAYPETGIKDRLT